MSNPYAPPEDRPREAAPGDGPVDDGAAAPDSAAPGRPGDGTTRVPETPAGPTSPQPTAPPAGPFHRADRSPEGVPYERQRRAQQATPPPNPADLRRLARLFRATGVLVLVAVVGDLLAFPWFVAAGLVSLAAIVVGVRALALAAQTGQRAPRTVLVLLLFVTALSLVRPATALATWDVESAFARCQAAAITVQAQNTCVSEYQQALNDRVGRLTGRTPAP